MKNSDLSKGVVHKTNEFWWVLECFLLLQKIERPGRLFRENTVIISDASLLLSVFAGHREQHFSTRPPNYSRAQHPQRRLRLKNRSSVRAPEGSRCTGGWFDFRGSSGRGGVDPVRRIETHTGGSSFTGRKICRIGAGCRGDHRPS